jgi:hypothetical protein
MIIKRSVVLLTLLLCSQAQAEGFKMSIGSDYNTGKYGTRDKTQVYTVPITASYEKGPVTVRVYVPYLRVTGFGDVVVSGLSGSGGSTTIPGSSTVVTTNVCTTTPDNSGSGKNGSGKNGSSDDSTTEVEDNVTVCTTSSRTVTTNSVTIPGSPTTTTVVKHKKQTNTGFGDITATAIYNVLDNNDWTVDLTGKVKLPTGDESKGLSNDETDYALQVNIDRYFGAPYVSFGLGYRWLGEPAGVNFDNVTYGSIGGGYKISQFASVGVSYDWSTSAFNGGPKPQEVSIFGSYRINEHYKLSAVLYGGLSNASPEAGGGVTLSYYF